MDAPRQFRDEVQMPAWAHIRSQSPDKFEEMGTPRQRDEVQMPAWARIRTPSPDMMTYFPQQGLSCLTTPTSTSRMMPPPGKLTPEPGQALPSRGMRFCDAYGSRGALRLDAIQRGMASLENEDEIPTPRLGPAAVMQQTQWAQRSIPQTSNGLSGLENMDNEVQQRETEGQCIPCVGPIIMMPCVAITPCNGNTFAPSRGSMGHPYSCGPACKYASKKRGCKDGAACDHCHLCTWRNHRLNNGASW